MNRTDFILVVILSTSLLTFLIRFLPVALLHKRRPPEKLARFLRSLPIAVLAALAAQSGFMKGGKAVFWSGDHYLAGLAVSLVLAVLTRSLAVIIFGGMAALVLIKCMAGG